MTPQIVTFPSVLFNEMTAALDGALAAAVDADVRDRIVAARRLVASASATTAETATGGLAPWQIAKVRAHVTRNIERGLPNDELAALTRLSTSYFCKAFRASFGETPQQFVLSRRVEQACALMLETPDTLADIAYACGFTDQAHFGRQFRRAMGTSPHAWRRHFSQDRAEGLLA
ncbi:MAG: AraC family transcriptional regulator [Pimelobacter sp.]|nr:AraC family transcriptional regulator [Pimelobacter sp.]